MPSSRNGRRTSRVDDADGAARTRIGRHWHEPSIRRNCAYWRGKGIASALKRAAIGWAITHGASWMAAENAIGNDAMRGINRALQPAPDFVEMRSPAITT